MHIHLPTATRDLNMIMVPKPAQDHSEVKGWRPIVLANTTGKLADKLVANQLQKINPLFHTLQYGSRQHRNATDCNLLAISLASKVRNSSGRASLLGKDVVSLFNNLQPRQTLQAINQHSSKSPHLHSYISRFLSPRHFPVAWDGVVRGHADMTIGTPQGSPLSPVLWLTFIATILKRADHRITQLCSSPFRRQSRTTSSNDSSFRVLVFSYAGDVNPLIISHNLSATGHTDLVLQVDAILDQEAEKDNISCGKSKHHLLHLDKTARPRSNMKTLGLIISSDLSWTDHIKSRVNKAEAAWHIMNTLGNSHRGMSPLALRALYTGKIRPILLWGAEFWYQFPSDIPHEMHSLEYKATRKITGGYYGSSAHKLRAIAHVEPLHTKISDMMTGAIQKLTRHADPLFIEILHHKPPHNDRSAPLLDPFHGTYPLALRDSPLSYAIAETGIDSPQELSMGNREDRTSPPLIDARIFDPQDDRSKSKTHWLAALAQRRQEGFRMVYTDGSGKDGQTAAGVFSTDIRGNEDRSYGSYLGPRSTSFDAEMQAIATALATEDSATVLIISDSLSAVQTTLALSRGEPPGSAIEATIKDRLHHRHNAYQDTHITWVRAHIGVTGNEKADKLAALHGTIGLLNNLPTITTPLGLRAQSRASRKEARSLTSFGTINASWGRQALSAYAWLRTNKGPLKSWLHHVKKAPSPQCPCGHLTQDGTTYASTALCYRKPDPLSSSHAAPGQNWTPQFTSKTRMSATRPQNSFSLPVTISSPVSYRHLLSSLLFITAMFFF